MNWRKIGFALLWLGFVLYAFAFAPPDQPDTFDLIKRLSSGDWTGINPLVVALFNIMGVWPIIYGCVLFIDGRGQKIPAFPFALGTFALGAFALLPYLALREENREFRGEKGWFLKLQDSRVLGVILLVSAIALVGWGVTQGDWGDFLQQWQTRRFIHVMSLDFCLLCVLFPALLGDDLARRGIQNPTPFWLLSLLPLFGPLVYLCVRPPVAEHPLREELPV
ncbi:hypothetical protein K4A83_13965 [Spirulina subsalsa FACHB-351]|uniref:DUF2834 domain-containing protein n=1 Tax=Spirulina subsalsa FACHB-351 TaxID=234711 RepID=A0ABT3L7A4_9CYAN|nr:hypothetical protein [Spirulina subsalsa]MCW6037370.1 hypothetical protein [Spirulina subsalsa FACHB-351]